MRLATEGNRKQLSGVLLGKDPPNPPHPNSGFPNRASKRGFPVPRGHQAALMSEVRGTSVHCPAPARPGLAESSARWTAEGGGGGMLPRLWLDKGYSLQELQILFLKKRRKNKKDAFCFALGICGFFPQPDF